MKVRSATSKGCLSRYQRLQEKNLNWNRTANIHFVLFVVMRVLYG